LKTSVAKAAKALTALAESLGLEFVDIQLAKEAGEIWLHVFVDKDGGISLSECENFHRKSLPMVEDIEYDYYECSSPGIDRPLKTPRDYQKHIGKVIQVSTFKKIDGQKQFEGTLVAYDEQAERFVLEQAGVQHEFLVKDAALVKPVIDYDALLESAQDEQEL